MQIEIYETKESGYHPLFLSDNWQVAILNYMDDQNISNINKIDIHHLTDEVFILHTGDAVLITATLKGNIITNWDVIKMKPGKIYNVPLNCWHNIAMEKNSSVYIVEKRETHISDFEFFYLNDSDKEKLVKLVNQAMLTN